MARPPSPGRPPRRPKPAVVSATAFSTKPDTGVESNGLHTIWWVVRDDGGAVQGVGSRFFIVSNS